MRWQAVVAAVSAAFGGERFTLGALDIGVVVMDCRRGDKGIVVLRRSAVLWHPVHARWHFDIRTGFAYPRHQRRTVCHAGLEFIPTACGLARRPRSSASGGWRTMRKVAVVAHGYALRAREIARGRAGRARGKGASR
ncbi:hypothetical protein KCP70_01230 [Salmonella enterica subsp. enterica]|nr:hypothetical protein KCP70_01230 [Salmonella enterica subsp. enterica]